MYSQRRVGLSAPHPPRKTLKRPVNERVEWRKAASLTANPRNSRSHPREQIHQLAKTIKALGVFVPILIDDDGLILAGHGRLEAGRLLEMTEVPTLTVSGLTESEKRAFVIADNRLAEMAKWDRAALRAEFVELVEFDIDVELTGFGTGQIDIILDEGKSADADELQDVVAERTEVTARSGDLWLLGAHRLFCGDSTIGDNYAALLEGRKANLVFADPPYNIPIAGYVSGLGKIQHREFAMGSGEMSAGRFTRFLTTVFGHLADHSAAASIHYICMDWRHLAEVLNAGGQIYSSLKNICVWNKENAGMGSLYRSQHEMVLVYQNGAGRFVNNIKLGATGRYRTNVWNYPGMTSMRQSRMDDLAMHPTVKPIALVADAMRDCSKKGALVLDPFSGSGTTIMAAQRTGRLAAAMEIDPVYVDVAIERWQKLTGDAAILAGTGEAFTAVTAARRVAAIKKDNTEQ
jgi:DNA modification methylase